KEELTVDELKLVSLAEVGTAKPFNTVMISVMIKVENLDTLPPMTYRFKFTGFFERQVTFNLLSFPDYKFLLC
ncbi:MAG: hypothetical protein BWK79_14690, partial [Beggiatoa sp. IS2]